MSAVERAELHSGTDSRREHSFEDRDQAPLDHDDRLILWMLELTPLKRLQALQEFVDGVTALQHARRLT